MIIKPRLIKPLASKELIRSYGALTFPTFSELRATYFLWLGEYPNELHILRSK
jgi:hypothetical protein